MRIRQTADDLVRQASANLWTACAHQSARGRIPGVLRDLRLAVAELGDAADNAAADRARRAIACLEAGDETGALAILRPVQPDPVQRPAAASGRVATPKPDRTERVPSTAEAETPAPEILDSRARRMDEGRPRRPSPRSDVDPAYALIMGAGVGPPARVQTDPAARFILEAGGGPEADEEEAAVDLILNAGRAPEKDESA